VLVIVFSVKGIPVILSNTTVTITGLKTVHQLPGVAKATRKMPHQTRNSPK
jgi:hypothetical protein